jgi:hypothetical protein
MATTISQQTRRAIYCRNNCGTEITFDNRKSKSGRSIPIDAGSGLPHQCPRSSYAQRQQPSEQKGEVIASSSEQPKEPTVTELLHELLYDIAELRKEIKEKLDVRLESLDEKVQRVE